MLGADMLTLLLYFLLSVTLLLALSYRQWPSKRTRKLISLMPQMDKGITKHLLIGPAFDLASSSHFDLFQLINSYVGEKGIGAGFFVGIPYVAITNPDMLQEIMSSMECITKGELYDTVKLWFGKGLLTSTGQKWHTDRKLLTPAFHFKILESNVTSFNSHAKVFIQKLNETNGELTGTHQLVKHCTLDIICDTAMGISLNAQNNENVEYVKNVDDLSTAIMDREVGFYYKINIVYLLSPLRWRITNLIKKNHEFTENVIKKRKEFYENEAINGFSKTNEEKKGKTFLDILIETEMSNKGTFTPEDMREQVDTFMFEGHDTMTVAVEHTLYCLGIYKDVQEKARAEVLSVVGENSDRDLVIADLNSLTYLEQVIKESLRLYPSVPGISRVLEKDLVLKDGTIIPATTNILIMFYLLHRNPDLFPNPTEFKPERFSDDKQRHSFSYLPFSAGPRNCIGQKFAMLELKTLLSYVLLNFEIKALKKNLKHAPNLVLKDSEPLEMKFIPLVK